MAKNESKTVQITTGVGTLCFPHLSKVQAEANKNDKGEPRYDIQIIIPKTQREDLKAIFKAIKEVGESKWGDKWKQVRNPLRDGDLEKDELTEDGSTKGEKYPERLGCYFINARSSKPVAVVGRNNAPLDDIESDLYAGSKGRINIGFYAYSTSGNHGIGAGLNGVQKVAEGEPLGGGGKPSIESMFDMLEDDDSDLDFEDETEVEETPAKKTTAKKAAAKKAPAKKKAAVEDIDLDDEDDQSDLDDLDD